MQLRVAENILALLASVFLALLVEGIARRRT
jgi:hypothetical protein